MKLGDVLKKEREQKRLTAEDVATKLNLSVEAYRELEAGTSPIEEWGPKLAQIAIKLSAPMSRLINETGKPTQAEQRKGQCGRLIRWHREKCEFTQEELARQLQWAPAELESIENGTSPLELYAPLLLQFAEVVDQPVFNLLYPCGLPFAELRDYP